MPLPIRKTALAALICGALFVSHAAQAASVQVYSNDFEVAASVAGGVTAAIGGAGATEGTQGYSAFGFGSNFLRNDTGGDPASATTLTLSGLGAHTSISLGFLLAVIDSWDGTQGCGPDFFNVRLDGSSIFSTDFANVRDGSCGPHSQSYGTANALLFPTNANIDFSGSSTSVGFSGWNDAAYDMALESLFQNVAHTGNTATFEFFASGNGWQGFGDESWGIDNVQVTLNGVQGNNIPEPGSLALLGAAGLAGLGVRRRRQKT